MSLETNISWILFIQIIVALIAGYYILKIAKRLIPQLFKRKSVSTKIRYSLSRVAEVYKPLSIVIAILCFVGINFKIHGIIILVAIILLYNYIKSYLNGVIFRINPMVEIGANIRTAEFHGQIMKFLFFGVFIREADRNRFINYSFIDQHGFSISQSVNTPIRYQINLIDVDNTTKVIDLLFENPIVDFGHQPVIKRIGNENSYELQISLERGGKIDTLMAYLNQHNIKTSISH